MYKNFKLTDEERKQIMEHHKMHGYKKPLKEQGELPTAVGGPKEKPAVTKTFKTTDPEYGKNIKQPERLVGKKATFYKNPEDAKMAYQAGKSNPQSEGSIIATIGNFNGFDQKTVTFSITINSNQSNYSITTRETNIYFNRTNGTFTISQPDKIAGTYYSESVKNILNDEFFSTELASNNKPQQTNMAEEIDTDDEEAELSRLYNDEDEYSYDLDSDVENGHFSSEFSDPDEWEDLHDFSVAKHRLPKEKADNMGYSRPRDMDYKGAKHHNEIPGAQRDNIQDYPTWDSRFVPKQKNSDSDYYLRTYGTPDPDMELQTLADLKKNQPLNFPKYTDKDRRDRENLLSWEEKKKLMAQRAEKKAARELARQARQGRMNESIQLTESELVNLIKKIINEQDINNNDFNNLKPNVERADRDAITVKLQNALNGKTFQLYDNPNYKEGNTDEMVNMVKIDTVRIPAGMGSRIGGTQNYSIFVVDMGYKGSDSNKDMGGFRKFMTDYRGISTGTMDFTCDYSDTLFAYYNKNEGQRTPTYNKELLDIIKRITC